MRGRLEAAEVKIKVEDVAGFGGDAGFANFDLAAFALAVGGTFGKEGDLPDAGGTGCFVFLAKPHFDAGKFDVFERGGALERLKDSRGIELKGSGFDDFFQLVRGEPHPVHLGVALLDGEDGVASDADHGAVLLGVGVEKKDMPLDGHEADRGAGAEDLDKFSTGLIVDFAFGQLDGLEGSEWFRLGHGQAEGGEQEGNSEKTHGYEVAKGPQGRNGHLVG